MDNQDSAPGGDIGATSPIKRRPLSLVAPAGWLGLQAAILIVAAAIFTFRPGETAQRFPGFLAAMAVSAVLIATARGLARAAPAGHVVAAVVYIFEATAFTVSLVRGEGGAWAAAQLVVAVAMLALLFSPRTRAAIDASRAERLAAGNDAVA